MKPNPPLIGSLGEPSLGPIARTTPERVTSLAPDEVFVFGSNLAGRHGKGAARDALKFGAVKGKGEGHYGQTYAIPTKDWDMDPLPIEDIWFGVILFLGCAASHPELTFLVTPIGCGLAGYKPSQIAPMFKGSPLNVVLPACFQQ